jgi:hypothetical protein
MSPNKIVLAVNVLDNADILHEYLEWYLCLGVDLIIVHDWGSSDGSQDILEQFARQKLVKWIPHPEKCVRDNDPSSRLARIALNEHNAEWIISCDTDEFLCIEGDNLRSVLDRAKQNDLTVLNVECFNMTGLPLAAEESFLERLTLRIDRPVIETYDQQVSGVLHVPYIFLRHPPKTIVRAEAFVEYAAGAHSAKNSWGRTGEIPELRFLHYPIRGSDAFQTKVRNITAFLDENEDLPSWWGWHWRRWIRLNREGRLREDYESQFVSRGRAEELIRDATCRVDETLSSWIKNKRVEPLHSIPESVTARCSGTIESRGRAD